MSTPDITLLEKSIFTIDVPVRIYDINYGNHLGHDSLISILHEARVAFLKQHQLTELNIFGISWIISNLNIIYKNQAFYGDTLNISIAASNITQTAFDFIHYVKIINKNNKDTEVAIASTKMIFFDYQINKVRKIPKEFLHILNNQINPT